jgi:hypothetical protein
LLHNIFFILTFIYWFVFTILWIWSFIFTCIFCCQAKSWLWIIYLTTFFYIYYFYIIQNLLFIIYCSFFQIRNVDCSICKHLRELIIWRLSFIFFKKCFSLNLSQMNRWSLEIKSLNISISYLNLKLKISKFKI